MNLTIASICLLLLAVVGCVMVQRTEMINYNEPILPEDFQPLIGPGFAVKYFTKDTKEPIENYNERNMQDIYDAGFRNVRLRCSAKPSMYPYPYNTLNFTTRFLDNLEKVVDKCLEVGIVPIISWANTLASNNATEDDQDNYVTWWTKVAKRLITKDYRCVFNLFTELLSTHCKKIEGCNINGTLHNNITKYLNWTSRVIKAIRGTGGNNKNRILILGSPKKGAWGCPMIEKYIYENDNYLMLEHHHYASGPIKKATSGRYWTGNGTEEQRKLVIEELEMAKENCTLKSYWGAWAAYDIKKKAISQYESESFSKYFVSMLKNYSVPWSLNALDMFYDTKTATWRTEIQEEKGGLNMSKILDVIKKNM